MAFRKKGNAGVMSSPHLHFFMKPDVFIQSRLDAIAQPVKRADIGSTPLEDAILAKVHSKKFRKLHVDQAAINNAKRSIATSVKNGEPIKLRLDFGGNKLWRLPEAPHIEWGEVFSLIYYVNWSKYIASVYEPGVLFNFFSMDVAVERLNNVPHEETDKYSEEFYALLAWAQPYVPKGVQLMYTRYGDLYKNRGEYDAEIEASKAAYLKASGGTLPVMDDKMKLATELNVKTRPGQTDDPEWHAQVELEHEAIFGTKTGAPYMEDPDWIPHCPTWYSGYIATGSTKSSIAKFWAGVGALKPVGDSFSEVILSPKQLESAQFDWAPTAIKGLDGEAFKRVRVLKK